MLKTHELFSSRTARSRTVRARTKHFGDLVERYRHLLCFLFLLFVGMVAFGHSALRPLFYDEIVTVNVAAFSRIHDVWQFYARGLDTPSPISSLLGTALVLFAIAVLAAWIPAQRASRVEPMQALRHD